MNNCWKPLMALSAPIALLALAVSFAASAEQVYRGFADFQSCDDKTTVTGRARLVERPSREGVKLVDVHVVVRGLPDGKHAVHIHETGECAPCSAAKGHFDPGPASASSPDGNHPFHSGDLINIDVRNELGSLHTTSSRVSLSPGPLSVFDEDGSAIIIHVDADTYCPEGEAKGCAGGARAACGIIKKF